MREEGPPKDARGPRRLRRRRHVAAAACVLTAIVTLAGPAAADPPAVGQPPDITVEATGSNGATVSFDLSGIASDDNGPPAIVCTPVAGTLFAIGSTAVSCTLTDTVTNESTQTGFNVIVQDTTPPVISGTPANITIAAGPSGTAVTYSNPTATDVVDGTDQVGCTPASGSTFAVGTTTVTCTATDAHGNSSHTTFTVSVQDTPPVISGTPSNIVAQATGPSGATVTYTTPTAVGAGNEPDPVTCLPASGSTFPIATTTVTCTATDTHGNSAHTTFTVLVQDTTPPVISGTPANITIAAGPSGTAVTYSNPTATDVVDGTDQVGCTPASGSTFAVGTTTVTCTATDAHGNSSHTTFTVSVQDTPPVISGTPSNIVAQATGPSGATVTYTTPTAVGAGNEPDPVTCLPASGSTFPIATTTVTCTATDTHGNSAHTTFSVLVQDTTPPVITVPTPITLSALGPAGAATTFAVSATDAVSGPLTPVCTPASGSTFPLGQTTVSCTAHDSSLNAATRTFTITVVDTVPPVLHAPGTIAVQATGPGGTVVTFSVTAVDAVDGAVVPACTPVSGSTFPMGQTTVTCSAKDAAGNSAAGSFLVSVTANPPPPPSPDRTPPVVTVPSAITAQAQGPAGTAVAFSATAYDAVDGSKPATCSPASGSVFAVGVTTVRCSAQDANGNTATKTFTVTVVDRTPPPAVVGLAAQAKGGYTQLRWQNPLSSDLDHVELDRTRLPDGSPIVLYSGVGTSYTDTHVLNGVRYKYTVFIVDASGNRSGVAVIVAGTALVLVRPADGSHVSRPPVLLWVPVAKADYYNVQLYREGSKVLSAWPSTNRYALPAKWTFGGQRRSLSSGVYHWYVWPGYGTPRSRKFGALLGTSTFVVTR